MFVRAKTVKGRKYAYLVDNSWKSGRVVQTVKRYLGPVRVLEGHPPLPTAFSLDTSKPSRSCLRDCIAQEFLSRGFSREKNKLVKGSLVIDLVSARIVDGNKTVVLSINDRYLYNGLLSSLLSFNHPESENDRPGEPLAQAFSDAGIRVSPDVFVSLYKKLYML